MKDLIKKLPKAELHLHIEGTFEPELMFEIAKRNNLKIKYSTIDELKAAYDFNNLQEFLDLYYEACNVLITKKDFYDLTYAYLKRAKENNIVHVEIMFDPQTHTERGIKFSTVIEGIHQALIDGEKDFGISYKLIMSFLRHLSEEAAFTTLESAKPYKEIIDAIGLDSSEIGHPPSKFTRVFAEARNQGYFITAHAGEEAPSSYVWEAIKDLKVDRIDHGNKSLEDPNLIKYLAENRIALTVCPLSNLKLKVVNNLNNHPLKTMLDAGLFVTINSDDPAYFGGYLNDNFIQIQEALNLSENEIIQLARNSIEASLLEDKQKKVILDNFKF